MSRVTYRAVAGGEIQGQRESRDGLPIALSPAVFIKPNSLQAPEAWVEHIPFAFWLMDVLRPSTFVELGTHSGNSYFAFCQAAKELELGTRCYAVDTWQGDDHAGRYGEEVFAAVTRHHDRHYKSFSRLIRSTFDQALDGFADNSIDLLHIDGLHTYEGVKHDFESWFPKLTPGAIVLFHDTNVRDRGFGVFKLWQELATRYPSVEFLHSNGLGVLSISATPPEGLREFFVAGQDKATLPKVRDIFSALGQVVSAQLIVERETAVRAEERDRLATLTVHHGAAMKRADALAAEAQALGLRAETASTELIALKATYEQTVAALDAHSTELIKARHLIADINRDLSLATARAEQAQQRSSQLGERLLRAEVERDELQSLSAELEVRTRLLEDKAARLAYELTAQRETSKSLLDAAVARAEEAEKNLLRIHTDAATRDEQANRRLAEAAQRVSVAESRLEAFQVEATERTEAAGRDLEKSRAENEKYKERLAELADEYSVAAESAREHRSQLATIAAQLNAPRWVARQLMRATRARFAEKFQKKRVARIAALSSTSVGPAPVDLKRIIADSGLFDEAHYVSQCADDAAAKADPIGHYLEIGAKQGKNPNEFFDSLWCLETHSDIAANNFNPLVHYILYGSKEGRSTSPDFDAGFYLRTHADVASAGLEPLRHFLENGRFEGRTATGAGQRQDGSSFFSILSSTRLGLVSKDVAEDEGVTSLSALLPASKPVRISFGDRRVDVVIPVYSGLAETRRCIESVLAHRAKNQSFGTLILVDDCGPVPALRKLLEEIVSREDGVVLLINEVNLGFVKSVNRAMRYSERDVVLLNADTEVHGNWLDRLASHGFSDSSVATVTAFSNNATICTFPEIGGAAELPFGRTLEEIDAAFAFANSGRAVEIPTGVGFCMFLSRKSLTKLGLFDEAYGKGYGEENDFSQKALNAGWRNLLAGDVFVYHHGNVSFGASAAAEQLTGGAMLRQRYPDYEPSVGRWIARDPARSLRFAALAALHANDQRPLLLHILHPWGGGTEKQVAEIATDWSERARHLILITRRREVGVSLELLAADNNGWRRYEFDVEDLVIAVPLLKSFGVSRIHIHHALEVMSELPAFLEAMDVPYDVSVHDYSLICPRNNLIVQGRYCGEPDDLGCLSCLRQEPTPRGRDIILWRHNGIGILEAAERVICPTIDVASRISRYAAKADVVAVPHEPELYRPARVFFPKKLQVAERMRIAAIGIFAEHKGGVFLLECIERARAQGLPIDWVVIGWFPGVLAERARNLRDVLKVTGPYDARDVQRLLDEADPHLVFFPQRCVETYSYTLSEALSSGRGILAPNLGAFPERISGVAGCWGYEVDLSASDVLKKLDLLRSRVFQSGDAYGLPQFVDARSSHITANPTFYSDAYLVEET